MPCLWGSNHTAVPTSLNERGLVDIDASVTMVMGVGQLLSLNYMYGHSILKMNLSHPATKRRLVNTGWEHIFLGLWVSPCIKVSFDKGKLKIILCSSPQEVPFLQKEAGFIAWWLMHPQKEKCRGDLRKFSNVLPYTAIHWNPL